MAERRPYPSREELRTRASTKEQPDVEDFAATTLDRPLVEISLLPTDGVDRAVPRIAERRRGTPTRGPRASLLPLHLAFALLLVLAAGGCLAGGLAAILSRPGVGDAPPATEGERPP